MELGFARLLRAAGIERLWLFDDPMYIALPVSHPLAARRRIRLSDFCDEEWMLGTSDRCPDALGALLHASGVRMRNAQGW